MVNNNSNLELSDELKTLLDERLLEDESEDIAAEDLIKLLDIKCGISKNEY